MNAPVLASAPALSRHRSRRVVRLWLPTVLLAALTLPLLPLIALAMIAWLPRPFAAAWGLWRLLVACSGTVVDVDTPHARVSIQLF
jgi:predicted Na+-dependent transporter